MRIYCNTEDVNNDITKFDQFIGKDLWVKCSTGFNNTCYYVKFLKRYHAYIYVLMTLPPSTPLFNELGWDKLHQEASTYSVYSFNLVEPLDILTTEQLFDMVAAESEDLHLFERYAGRDFWILAKRLSDDWMYYIHINSIEDGIMSYDRADAETLNNPEICEDYFGPPSEDRGLRDYNKVSLVSAWEIVHPMDGMTTDEVDDSIAVCDEIWENAHMDDTDDEDEEL